MKDKSLDCGLLECDWNENSCCSWSNLPYECPCHNSEPRYEDNKIVEWIPNEE